MSPVPEERLRGIDLFRPEQQRLAALLGQGMACVLELSIDARVLRVNDEYCHITGFSRESLLGRHLAECVPPEDWPAIRELLDALPARDTPPALEMRLNCRNGGFAWVNGTFGLVRDDAGEPTVFIALLLDISASMRVRERLLVAEERFRLALDGARMGVWYLDLVSGQSECSELALDYLGLPRDAKPGLAQFLARVHPAERASVEAAVTAAVKTLQPIDIEFRVMRPDDSERWLALAARARRDASGSCSGLQGLVSDISSRKSAELLLQRTLQANLEHTRQIEALNTQLAQRAVEAGTAVRAREALLRNVSHELRTPLNHISGSLEILLSGELAEPQRRWLMTAHEAAASLARVIDGVIDVARLAAGEVQQELQDFAPATVLGEVAGMLSGRVKARQLELRIEVAQDVPRWVSGDGAHVAQIVLNFLDNAIKFAPGGRITLSVRCLEPRDTAYRLRFEVQDTGSGIPQELLASLFTPFVQGDDSVARSHGGLGIGLSNARELAELMGGLVGVESRPGEGSTFWLEVPVHAPQLALGQELAPPVPAEQRTASQVFAPAELTAAMDYLKELHALLCTDDMRARASLHTAAPSLRALAGEEDFAQLLREVGDFDFPAAAITCDRMAERLSLR